MKRDDAVREATTMPPGCGYACPYRDTINGRCDRHGPTIEDQIVEQVTAGFKRDLRAILRSGK